MPDSYRTKRSWTLGGNSSPAKGGHLSRSARRAESNLQPSSQEYLLRALIDCVPDYLFVKDTEGRFVVANSAVAEDLGFAVRDLIGKTDFDLHSRERAEKFFSDEQAVIE